MADNGAASRSKLIQVTVLPVEEAAPPGLPAMPLPGDNGAGGGTTIGTDGGTSGTTANTGGTVVPGTNPAAPATDSSGAGTGAAGRDDGTPGADLGMPRADPAGTDTLPSFTVAPPGLRGVVDRYVLRLLAGDTAQGLSAARSVDAGAGLELNWTVSVPGAFSGVREWRTAARDGDAAALVQLDGQPVQDATAAQAQVDTVLIGGAVISVGVAFWATRASVLLAGLLASTPAWQGFDPLPVVRRRRDPHRTAGRRGRAGHGRRGARQPAKPGQCGRSRRPRPPRHRTCHMNAKRHCEAPPPPGAIPFPHKRLPPVDGPATASGRKGRSALMDQLIPGTKPTTILVVDDTPDNLSLMSALLKDYYKVKVANHGDKGLRIAASDQPPDLILLDIMMPDIDGYEVCRRLKADPRTRDIPVIFPDRAFGGGRRDARGWSWARPTTSPSRSAPRSCWRACRRT